TALRRTRVGALPIDHAQDLPEPDDDAAPVQVLDLTAACTAVFEVLHLPEPAARALRYGQYICRPPFGSDGSGSGPPAAEPATDPADSPRAAPVAAMHPDGHVVALVEPRGEQLKPVLVLDPA